ncbi:MAG TPA: aquaporin family protein [Saprospiraceae bacterium]|nr:aquaporin family protein [Saprospiraceae bacterium]
MTPFIAEIIGTAILLLLGNGIVANEVLAHTKGNSTGWILITFGWGMAVFVAVLITADYSGAHLNPAVTIGLATAGKFAWAKVPMYILAQMIGAAIGTTLVWLVYLPHYQLTENPAAKLATFCTGTDVRHTFSNVLSEALGTFILVFAVLYIVPPNFVTKDPNTLPGLGALGALPVGFVVLVIGMALGGTTGYAINPARDLAPRIMYSILPISNKGGSDWGYAWIPIVSPILGALLAAALYLIL